MRIYWIEDFIKPGKLGMMARPKGNDWLKDEVDTLSRFGVNMVVSHLEKEEEYELGLTKEKEICLSSGIDFISYPVADRSIPKNKDSYKDLISVISERLKQGERVIIHCRMGIGRTGMTAAAILLKNGFDPNQVFDYLIKIRTLNMPDTKEQVDFVKKINVGNTI